MKFALLTPVDASGLPTQLGSAFTLSIGPPPTTPCHHPFPAQLPRTALSLLRSRSLHFLSVKMPACKYSLYRDITRSAQSHLDADDDLISLADEPTITSLVSTTSVASASSRMVASHHSPVKLDSFFDLTVMMKAKMPYTQTSSTSRAPLSLAANGKL